MDTSDVYLSSRFAAALTSPLQHRHTDPDNTPDTPGYFQS